MCVAPSLLASVVAFALANVQDPPGTAVATEDPRAADAATETAVGEAADAVTETAVGEAPDAVTDTPASEATAPPVVAVGAQPQRDALEVEKLARENEALRARLTRLEDAVAGLSSAAPPPPPTPAAKPSESPDAWGWLRPTVLGEIDYRVYPSEEEGNSGFAVARLRPGLTLAPTPWFRAVATVEYAGEHPVILDAFLQLRATHWVTITAGHSKPPMFASFVQEPVHTLPFPDRAPVVTSFRVRRDVGADVRLAPLRVPLEACVRIGNGSGSPLGNDNMLPAGYGALDLVLGRAWEGASAANRRHGLRLGGSVLVESVRDRDGISGQTPLGFVYFRPIVVSGLRVVGQGHAVGYVGPVRLTVEGAVSREERSRDDDGNQSTPRTVLPELYAYGLTAEVAWVVVGSPREVGWAPRGRSKDGRWGGGALELAARYDGMWLGRGAEDVTAGGSQGGALAIKWWPVAFMAATVFGYVTRYDEAPIEEPEDRWSWGIIARASFFWGLPGMTRTVDHRVW